jgi:uncharacterized protein YidB (DUF937 family)
MGHSDKALDLVNSIQTQWFNPSARLGQAVLGMLSDNGQGGGLYGLIERFQEAGLENIIRSWISSGPNLLISSDQIQHVLDRGYLRQISEETGLSQDQTASILSEALPGLIDRFTPDGKLPQNGLGDIGTMLGQLAKITGVARQASIPK